MSKTTNASSRASASQGLLASEHGPRSSETQRSPRIIICLEKKCSFAWHNVDTFFQDGFDFNLDFASSPAAFGSLLETNPNVDIIVIPSCPNVLRQYEKVAQDFRCDLSSAWAVVDALGSSLHWLIPQTSAKVVAVFAGDIHESELLPRFVSIVFDRWRTVKFDNFIAAPSASDSTSSDTTQKDSTNRDSDLDKRILVPSRHTASIAGTIIKARKNILGTLAAEPLLSIMLELFHNQIMWLSTDVTSISAQLQLPLSTLTRKLDYLEDRKMIKRQADEDDRRRVRIVMTAAGAEIIRRYLETIRATIG